MMDLFDIINSIQNRELLEWDSELEKAYNPVMVNRGLSQNPYYIESVNMMNLLPNLPKKLQYLFLFHTSPGKKSYGKWAKKTEINDTVELIAEYYQINRDLALNMSKRLNEDQISIIRGKLNIRKNPLQQ